MSRSTIGHEDVAGVILAGGQSRRMGDAKALRPLAGKPMIAHVIERLRPQLPGMIINANGDAAAFAEFGLPVAADVYGDYAGPLAGVLTGMRWAQQHAPGVRWIVTAACDTPFLPRDYVEELARAIGAADPAIAVAASGSGHHYVLGLWAVGLAGDLAAYLEGGGRKVRDWVERQPHFTAEFAAKDGRDPFFNINTPEDFAMAELLLREKTA